MNIHGKKYLDANLYDEILVLNNKVNVTGNIKFTLKKGSESFSDDLERKGSQESDPGCLVHCSFDCHHFFFGSLSRAIVSSIALLMKAVVLSPIS